MKSFWLFRTNLRPLEYYHSYNDLKTFKKECHDFYLLMGIWFLENNIVDEVIVWRLQPKEKVQDIVFDVNGKKFIQKFVDDFKSCFSYPKPFMVLWRGGFKEYDDLTLVDQNFFSPRSFYLGAGRRTTPMYGGKYNRILVEDDSYIDSKFWPFYKTANPEIFKPLKLQKKYNICWVCNFAQLKFKGQEFFINEVSKSKYLRGLSIVHIGNDQHTGTGLCKKLGVNNITFLGQLSRPEINRVLNESHFGLVTSNSADGSPRVITEVMMSGTPLLVRKETKLLSYYKKFGVAVFRDDNVESLVEKAFKGYDQLRSEANINITSFLTMKTICEKNLELWLPIKN